MPDLIIYSIILKHGSKNTMKNQNKELASIQRRERRLRRAAVQDLKQENLSYELIKGNLFKNNSYESATSASQLTVAQLYNVFQDGGFKFAKPFGPKCKTKGKFERLYQFIAEVKFAASLHENGVIQNLLDFGYEIKRTETRMRGPIPVHPYYSRPITLKENPVRSLDWKNQHCKECWWNGIWGLSVPEILDDLKTEN